MRHLERDLQKQLFGGIPKTRCFGRVGNNPWKIPVKKLLRLETCSFTKLNFFKGISHDIVQNCLSNLSLSHSLSP